MCRRTLTLTGAKDSLARGLRRYNAQLRAHNKKPALPLRGNAGGGMVVTDFWPDNLKAGR